MQDKKSAGTDSWGFGLGTQPSFLIALLEEGAKTKEQTRSAFINHFYPNLSYAEATGKSGFNVFFSDSKRPVGTYHASRALRILENHDGVLSLDDAIAAKVKEAIRCGILGKLRGLHFQRDRVSFNRIQEEFGLPIEP